jgi:hypothetical protein
MSTIGRLQTWLYIAGTSLALGLSLRITSYSVLASNVLFGFAFLAIVVGIIVEYGTQIVRIKLRTPWLLMPRSDLSGALGTSQDLELTFIQVRQAYEAFEVAFLNLKDNLENAEQFKQSPMRSVAEPLSRKELYGDREDYLAKWQALWRTINDFRDEFRHFERKA